MRSLLPLLLCLCAGAADWRQWRGFSRNGNTDYRVNFDKLPPELTLHWETETGRGTSGPLLSGGRVYTFTWQQGREVVRALRSSDGTEIWKADYPVPAGPSGGNWKGPASTPLIYNGTWLYTRGYTGILSCWNLADGKLLWRNDYSKTTRLDKLYPAVTESPLANGGRLFLQLGDSRGGSFVALDARTGKQVWAARTTGGPSMASPMLHEFRGVSMLVALTGSSVVALAEKDGRLLWSHPWKGGAAGNAVSPLIAEDRVLLSGSANGTAMLEMSIHQDGTWSVREAWKNPAVAIYPNSPVLDGETVYGVEGTGQGKLFAMDWKTGKVLWQADEPAAADAELLRLDNAIAVVKRDGEVLILRKDAKKFDLARRMRLGAGVIEGHPAFAGGELLVKDASKLRKYSGL